MKKLFSVILALLLSGYVSASEAYVINTEIIDSGNLIGSPVLTVAPNKQATISENNSYELSLNLSPVENSIINVSSVLKIGDEVINPTMSVYLGKKASIIVNDIELSITVTKSSY